MESRKKIFFCIILVAFYAKGWTVEYKDKFVWIFGYNFARQEDTEKILSLLETASYCGYNGVALSAGLDSLSRQNEKYFAGLEKIKKACALFNLEIIPAVFSVGYGSVISHDRNLAEGLPVKDALFLVKGNEAIHQPEGNIAITNGGFEDYQGNRLKGFRFHDQPNRISFVDTGIKHSGNSSLRFENFTLSPHGNGRIMQEVEVIPYRCYRVSIWVKTENLKPAGNFRLLVLGDNRDLAPGSFNLPPTTDWRKLTMMFNSMEFSQVKIYAGIWAGKQGKFWVDDWQIEEVGPYNILRRPGTPVLVKGEDGFVYQEGRDYARLTDSYLNPFRKDFDYPAPKLKILPDSRIKDNQHLRVSWYHPLLIYDSQVTVCMAEPALFEIFDREARLLWEKLRYKKVILNMDEIRMGGTCQACAGKNMAQLLGDCVNRQVEILRKYNPGVQIYIWSDMFDPHHNARLDYYLVRGDFTGSWNYLPQDIIVAVWGGKPREKSLKFFSEKGFSILIANYYDAGSLEDVKNWLQMAETIPGVRGFMYTTWEKKYDLLGEYFRLIFQKKPGF